MCVLALAVMLLSCPSSAAQDGLAMMKVEAGARPSGMGGAFVSIAADPYSSMYNPAGAGGVSKFTAGFGHNEYWENVRIETGYFTSPLTGRFFVHGGIRFAGLSHIEVRTETPTLEPDALSDAHDVSLKAGLAYRISEKVFAGIGLGWFIEKIDAYRGSAFDCDLGILGHPTNDLAVGASVTNLGSSFELNRQGGAASREISLPTTYRLGASYTYGKDYLGAADIVIVDDEAHLHIGAEGRFQRYFAVRAGYMFNYDTKNFTAGASFSHRNVKIDYAFVPYTNDLGNSHLFNVTFEL